MKEKIAIVGAGKKNIIINKMSPLIDVETFNKNKVSEEFMKSCEIAGKLFKQSKEESLGKEVPTAQPHDSRC